MNTRRPQTQEEELANTITHGIGVVFTLIGIPFLLNSARATGSVTSYYAVCIFGGGMLAVYLSSTLYHAAKSAIIKRRLHICDHVSIYFLIGGTYAPIVVHYLDSHTAAIFLILQWMVICCGAILKIFFTGRFEAVSLIVYLFLGWSALFLVEYLWAAMSFEVFIWILTGGLSYTIGVIFYRMDKHKYAHSIWHLFVLGGTAAHYIAIAEMFSMNR